MLQAGVPEENQLEAIGETAAKVNQRTLAILEMPVLWDDHQEEQQQ